MLLGIVRNVLSPADRSIPIECEGGPFDGPFATNSLSAATVQGFRRDLSSCLILLILEQPIMTIGDSPSGMTSIILDLPSVDVYIEYPSMPISIAASIPVPMDRTVLRLSNSSLLISSRFFISMTVV